MTEPNSLRTAVDGRDVIHDSSGVELDEQRLAPLIALAAVAVDIHNTPVLRGLDFDLPAGGVVGIIGGNGSGKTTLLQLAATLRRPAAGTARILGMDLRRPALARARRSICLVGHQPALYPTLSLRENLLFVAKMVGESRQVAESALKAVGLADAANRRAERCSQGMIKRADLARALIGRPRLLLLDEPHAALDSSAADLVDFLVADVRGRGGGALVVSHDRGRLDPLVDTVFELIEGRLNPIRKSS